MNKDLRSKEQVKCDTNNALAMVQYINYILGPYQ